MIAAALELEVDRVVEGEQQRRIGSEDDRDRIRWVWTG
jgi:hypothetical protein